MFRRILTVVGARPQFVKAAVVSRAINAHNAESECQALHEEIIHTGQHYDYLMSGSFFEEMEIPPPAVNLGVGSGPHGEMTGAMLAALEVEICRRGPDLVLVYGDTNSTLAGALAAAKLRVPVAHVEAGLRSFNRAMPEEINRVLTDRISALLFCPSEGSKEQLAKEGIREGVRVVGDVMHDATLFYGRRAIPQNVSGPFAAATIHRAENTDSVPRLRGIMEALGRAPLPVVLPLHPRTRAAMIRAGISAPSNVRTTEPLSYFGMLGLLKECTFVVTDSGGLQKEAYYLGKRCVTVRDETEWTELVECGANRVVGAECETIEAAFAWAARPLTCARPLYGLGDAGVRIVNELIGR